MKRFEKLISQMPAEEQAFTSKRKTWEKFDKKHKSLIDEVFKGEDHVEISRGDLIKLAKNENLKEFILSTIIWGYSSGMRGNHFQNIFDKIDVLENHLNKLELNNGHLNWNNHLSFINEIRGLGLSTYSKFLYFMGVKIDGYSALILDIRITEVFNKKTNNILTDALKGTEYEKLSDISYEKAPKMYSLYLKFMDSLAKKHGVTPDQLEMFLFTFGSSLKPITG